MEFRFDLKVRTSNVHRAVADNLSRRKIAIFIALSNDEWFFTEIDSWHVGLEEFFFNFIWPQLYFLMELKAFFIADKTWISILDLWILCFAVRRHFLFWYAWFANYPLQGIQSKKCKTAQFQLVFVINCKARLRIWNHKYLIGYPLSNVHHPIDILTLAMAS